MFDSAALPAGLAGMDKAAIRARVNPLLELVGLAHLADEIRRRSAAGRSSGVGIARALASRPKVLLSDEATSALDPETTRSILDLLRQVNREETGPDGGTHHAPDAGHRQVADRVAVINTGRIVEQDELLDVFTRPQQAITRGAWIGRILRKSCPPACWTMSSRGRWVPDERASCCACRTRGRRLPAHPVAADPSVWGGHEHPARASG